ncbi:hypothetical protein MHI24_15505 [Paenibacillus sp. FSL K6-1096]|uniref:hypothetical protein n=1 Tax=Paenibacillus sp. FSL K6-1096 TaxID=2921460 RepID=UPI0030EF9F76
MLKYSGQNPYLNIPSKPIQPPQAELLEQLKSWMLANNWLEETEYILLRMNDDAPAAVHPDYL